MPSLRGEAEEPEVVAVPGKRQDLLALRAEVRVGRRAGTAVPARLDGDGLGVRGHGRIACARGVARRRAARGTRGPPPRYTVNDVPQLQLVFAFGFWKTKPLLIRLVS